jgi:magnesium transporter
MNFKFMPELDQVWGYPVVWIVFIFLGLGMVYYFRHRRWL